MKKTGTIEFDPQPERDGGCFIFRSFDHAENAASLFLAAGIPATVTRPWVVGEFGVTEYIETAPPVVFVIVPRHRWAEAQKIVVKRGLRTR